MSELPERISPDEFRRLPQESRLVANLVKMTAYVIEGKLAGILKNLHNGVNGNERGLCSGFCQSTGALSVSGNQLHVTLEKQGDPSKWRVLEKEINSLTSKLRSKNSRFGTLTLHPEMEDDKKKYDEWLETKTDTEYHR